ncbi:MAG: thermonuclease family protein [bacterium]
MGRLKTRATAAPLLPLITFLLVGTPACTGPPAWDRLAVERVVDGDTLLMAGGDRVRLLGIDAPELRGEGGDPECYAEEAARMLEELIDRSGGRVRLEGGSPPRDVWGRTLAWVWDEGGRLLNEEMLREGCARLYEGAGEGGFAPRLAAAEARAREGSRGFWHPLACEGITPR